MGKTELTFIEHLVGALQSQLLPYFVTLYVKLRWAS